MVHKYIKLNLANWKISLLFVGIFTFLIVGVVIAGSINNKEKTETNIGKGQDFTLQNMQDEDSPVKILEATVKVISPQQYQEFTTDSTTLQELISVPKVTIQNVSEKTITGIALMINDNVANTRKGYYLRNQSIKSGEQFVIQAESLVGASEKAEQNTKFWLSATDKTKVGISVAVFFDDGSMFANKDKN